MHPVRVFTTLVQRKNENDILVVISRTHTVRLGRRGHILRIRRFQYVYEHGG